MRKISFNIKREGYQVIPDNTGVLHRDGRFVRSYPPNNNDLRSSGVYTLTCFDRHESEVKFIIPQRFSDPSFFDGYDQRLPQGRLKKEDVAKPIAKFKEFWEEGRIALESFAAANPGIFLISDASNYPFNEGHFAISDGKLLPMPKGETQLTGRHYIMDTTGGEINFPIVNTEDPNNIGYFRSGFFLSKIIHEGKPIGLMDQVPGTGNILISDYRGHIGQIFKEDEYSAMNSPERAAIHSQLIEYLRDPVEHRQVLEDIIAGKAHDFGDGADPKKYPNKILPQNIFTHTYWIESKDLIYCLKTYPQNLKFSGVTFAEGPYLLQSIAKAYGFTIDNAYLGTNGRDVRMSWIDGGQIQTITKKSDRESLGDYFSRPLANFVAIKLN